MTETTDCNITAFTRLSQVYMRLYMLGMLTAGISMDTKNCTNDSTQVAIPVAVSQLVARLVFERLERSSSWEVDLRTAGRR